MDGIVMALLDTSALIFWTLDRDRLSNAAAQAIADADRIALSAISIWEIGIKVKKQQLVIPVSIREFTDRLEQVDRVEILPVCARTWIRNLELDWGPSGPRRSDHRRHRRPERLPHRHLQCDHPGVLLTDHLVDR